MPIVIIPANVSPEQIEGFPEGAKRSVKGAVYIRPASTLELTEDELKHIAAIRPDLSKCFIVHRQEEAQTLEDILKSRPELRSTSPRKAAMAQPEPTTERVERAPQAREAPEEAAPPTPHGRKTR